MTPDNAAISSAIRLQPAKAEDTEFLLKLFASTREEFKMLIGDEGQLAALVSMQFNFQRQQFQDGYPESKDHLVLLNEKPVGRILVDESDATITLIDVALLPEYRNRGIGRQLLDNLIEQARGAQKPVILHVSKINRARNLYERLGFRQVSEDGMYYEMICEPQPI